MVTLSDGNPLESRYGERECTFIGHTVQYRHWEDIRTSTHCVAHLDLNVLTLSEDTNDPP
jgi:hypothetical protein